MITQVSAVNASGIKKGRIITPFFYQDPVRARFDEM